MQLRPYRTADCAELAALFFATVHPGTPTHSPPAPRAAGGDGQVDLAAWDKSFLAHRTLVAEGAGRIVGFADLDASGYLDRLYVHRDFQRRGAAAALCGALEAAVPGPWTTHASITARPFFEARGYRVVRAQQVERHGVLLTNFVMEKPAPPAAD